MNKFNLTKFLTENKLTQLGKLTEMGQEEEEELFLEPDPEDLYGDVTLSHGEREPYKRLGSEEGPSEDDDDEDYSKYNNVEEQIETSTNEAAHKHKMERVEKAYKYLEEKASSLEEGGDANFLNPAKLKEMKTSAKKLRMMHEKLLKEYDKKYASKKKVDLNEEVDTEFPLSADDVAAMAGGSSIRVYKKGGGRVHTYSNGQEFLDFFNKNEPNLVYKQESPGVFAASDVPLEKPRGYVAPSEPVDRDRGVQSFYDKLKYKGD
jgi:hypothetical protein